MVAKLITRRRQLKGVLKRFWSYVSADDSDVEQILVRKEKIEEVWQEFNQVQSELEMDEQNDGDELCNYRTEFE